MASTMVLWVLAPAQAEAHWDTVWVVSLCLRIEPWAHNCEELSGGVSCPQKSLETEAVSYRCSANRCSLVKQSCNTSKLHCVSWLSTQLSGLFKKASKIPNMTKNYFVLNISLYLNKNHTRKQYFSKLFYSLLGSKIYLFLMNSGLTFTRCTIQAI